jgi:hypothetical protein
MAGMPDSNSWPLLCGQSIETGLHGNPEADEKTAAPL